MRWEEEKGNNESHYLTEARVPSRELLRVQLQQEFQESSVLDYEKSNCQVYRTGVPGEKGDSSLFRNVPEKRQRKLEGHKGLEKFYFLFKKEKNWEILS